MRKKGTTLECLERYVIYLHEQLNLIGTQPVALERVSNYRGLSSRSIRVCLHNLEFTELFPERHLPFFFRS